VHIRLAVLALALALAVTADLTTHGMAANAPPSPSASPQADRLHGSVERIQWMVGTWDCVEPTHGAPVRYRQVWTSNPDGSAIELTLAGDDRRGSGALSYDVAHKQMFAWTSYTWSSGKSDELLWSSDITDNRIEFRGTIHREDAQRTPPQSQFDVESTFSLDDQGALDHLLRIRSNGDYHTVDVARCTRAEPP